MLPPPPAHVVRVPRPPSISSRSTLAIAQAGPAAPSQPNIADPALQAELLAMMREDQLVRKVQPLDPEKLAAIDRKHHDRLVQIMARGWPGYRRVGPEGSDAAWLLIQHQDHDPALQRRALTLLEAAVAAHDASPQDLAYLTDRVLLAEGKQQKYGTQYVKGPHGWVLRPTSDPAHLDARRRAVGMAPEADYLRELTLFYHPASNVTLQRELVKMQDADRRLVEYVVTHPDDRQGDARLKALRRKERRRLEQVLARAWPGYREVGLAGSQALLTLVNFQDPAFETRCLKLLQAAAARHDESLASVAQLTDVIRMTEKRKQLYGTLTVRTADGKLVASPTEDPQHLDERRHAMGLPPEADYLRSLNR